MKITKLFRLHLHCMGIVVIFVLIAGIAGCARKSVPSGTLPTVAAMAPVPPNLPDMNSVETISEVYIPVTVDSPALIRQINALIPQVIYEDTTLTDDNMTIRAEKMDSVDIRIFPNKLVYDVPLKINIVRDIGITHVKADGALKLFFNTEYSIQPDWSIQSVTTILDHEWIEKPRVRFGVLQIPIESIASRIVRRSSDLICKQIDAQLQEGFKLRDYIDQAWRKIQLPILITEKPHPSWLLLRPEKILMVPLHTLDGQIQTLLVFRSKTDMVFGAKPVLPYAGSLPIFEQINQGPKDSLIELSVNFPLRRAEILLTDYFRGQEFRDGNRVMMIDSVSLSGQGNKLKVETYVSGTYPVKLEMEGIPVYNAEKRRFELAGLDYSINSKNILVKAASWILKKNFQKKLAELLTYEVGGYMDSGKMNLAQALSQVRSYGFKMEPVINDAWALHPVINGDQANVTFLASGHFQIRIDQLVEEK